MITIIGGTGDEGLGLAMRFAAAGEAITIGSRSAERAQKAALKVLESVPGAQVGGAENAAACEGADLIIISVPFSGQRDTLTALQDQLAGKLVVSIVVPMEFGQGGARAIAVTEGSAAEQAKSILGPESRVVSAFQNLSAHELMEMNHSLDSDVIVCGGSNDDRKRVMDLAGLLAGCRGIDGGPLRNSRFVEDITVLLVGINRRYKTQAGIKLVNVA